MFDWCCSGRVTLKQLLPFIFGIGLLSFVLLSFNLKQASDASSCGSQVTLLSQVKDPDSCIERLQRYETWMRRVVRPLPLLIFIHIPKAGGHTIENYVIIPFAYQIGAKFCQHKDNFLSYGAKRQQTVWFIGGHQGYGIHQRPEFQLTEEDKVSREPLEKVLTKLLLLDHSVLHCVERTCVARYLPVLLLVTTRTRTIWQRLQPVQSVCCELFYECCANNIIANHK